VRLNFWVEGSNEVGWFILRDTLFAFSPYNCDGYRLTVIAVELLVCAMGGADDDAGSVMCTIHSGSVA
jgi:hypothetical protein